MNTAEISFIVILAVMVAFFLIFILPSQREQKRLQDTIRDLQVGDEVITTAGFFGRITEINTPEEGPVQLVIDFGNGLKVRALTTSILRRVVAAGELEERPGEAKGA